MSSNCSAHYTPRLIALWVGLFFVATITLSFISHRIAFSAPPFGLLLPTPSTPPAFHLNAPSATHTITNTNDSGVGSLRDAINSATPGDVIPFGANVSGTITLTTGELFISNSLSLGGPGAMVLAVNGNNANRVFHVGLDASVTISGLSITNGDDTNGAGIYVEGSLALTNTLIHNNVATLYGGGIHNDGTLIVARSAIIGNNSSTGGGIFNQGTLTITETTLANNNADSGGGGISNNGVLVIAASTLNGNRANFGGALEHRGGTLALLNSTVSGNDAPGTNSTDGGGALDQYLDVTSDIVNSTVVSNSAIVTNATRSGLWLESGTLTLKNSLVTQNGITNNFQIDGGVFTSNGYNLSNGNIPDSAGTDISNTLPLIGPLALNGNTSNTFTHALLSGSPAIDAIPLASCTDANGDPLTSDQRGVVRPQGTMCDIGAFEFVLDWRRFLPVVVAP